MTDIKNCTPDSRPICDLVVICDRHNGFGVIAKRERQ
jgi:hypothetical protein